MQNTKSILLLYISLTAFTLTDAGVLNTTGLTAQQKRYAQLYWDYAVASRVVRSRNTSISSDATGALPPRLSDGRSPAYHHGYKFMIPLFERLSGLSYVGHAARLRYALERARAGEALRIGVLGGSISQGAGAGGPYRAYATLYKEWLNAALPPTFTTHKDQKRRSVLEVDGGPEGGVQAVGDVPRFGGSEEATGSDAGGLSRDGQLISGCDDEWGTAALAASVERALQEAAAVAGAEQEGTQPGEGISSSGSRVRRRLRNFSRRWPLERGGEGLAAGEQVHRDGGSLGRQLRADLQQQEQQQQRIVGRVQEGTDEEDQQANANKVEERGGDGRGSGSGGKLPAMHRLANGAVPGTVSSYMASCMQYHLPLEEVDIVLVEYAVNDRYAPSKDWQDEERRAFERLVRKLLRLPRSPAVVLVNMFAFQSTGGRFWKNAERDFHELAMYYGLPSVSLKAAVLPSAAGGTSPIAPELDPGAIFTGGQVHPGMGGHVVVAELLITLSMELLRADHHLALLVPLGTAHRQRQRDLKSTTTTSTSTSNTTTSATVTGTSHAASSSSSTGTSAQSTAGLAAPGAAAGVVAASSSGRVPANLAAAVEVLRRVAGRPLPAPMADDNWDTGATTCYLGQDVKELAVASQGSGWSFTDEGRGKWGWVATEQGSSMQLKVSTLASRDAQRSKQPVVVQVAYLQSYHAMGAVRMSCVAGCICKDTTMDAFSERQTSVTVLSDVQVSQHKECVLELRTIGPGPGGEGGSQEGAGEQQAAGGGGPAGGKGGRRRCRSEKATCRGSKFKLVGLVVGEEPGSTSGSINWVRGQTLGGAGSSRK